MEQKIIQEYLNGKSINQLSKEYSVSYHSIQKLLRDNNITIRGGRKKIELTDIEKAELTEQYNNYIPIKEIALKLHYNVDVINRTIKELGLTRSSNRVNRNIKSNFFSNIDSPIKAYWLGLLFTDGSVDHYKTTGRIRIQLQEQDLDILKQYQEDLGIESKIIYDTRPNSVCCSVEFVDEQIFNDLGKYGIVPNKTYECKHIPYELIPKEYWPAFALGLYDGDGGLSCSANFSTDVTMNFTSYYESVVQDFQILIDLLINKENHTKNFFTSAWHTQWRGRKQVLEILDYLYSNCPRHLERKYQKYLQLKNSLK